MVHGHHRIEGFGIALNLEKNGVGRIRTVDVDASLPCGLHRRADDIELLAAETAVVTVVRVKATDADPRLGKAVTLERRVDQLDGFHDPGLTEQPRHLGECHMRRHSRSPEVVEHVELAERSVEIQVLGEPVQLVAMGHARHVQRGLVQRAKQQCVSEPLLSQAQTCFQSVQTVLTTDSTGLGTRELALRRAAVLIEQRGVITEVQGLQ
ncbi:hypothetical protein D3C86_1184230 [compost metagenome]